MMNEASPLTVSIANTPAELSAPWRALERDGIATPYQRYGFVAAWLEHVGKAEGVTPVIALIGDEAGPLALLPFCLERRHGLRILRFTGGKHANFNMGLFRAGARLSAAALQAVQTRLRAETGADLLMLDNQPYAWEGFANPLAALPSQPSPGPAYKFAISPDWESVLNAKFSHDSRHKLRRKERKLGEVGAVRYTRAGTEAEAEAILEAFAALKAARFKQLGLADVFSEAGVAGFLRQAALDGLQDGKPALDLYACYAGSRIVATFGAAVDEQRFCGMFTAFDGDPEISRWSPGDLLLLDIVQQTCARGLKTFDLGIGEARYKQAYCDQTEPLFDCIVPLSLKGRIAALAMRLARQLKRRIKQSPRAMALLAKLRQLRR